MQYECSNRNSYFYETEKSNMSKIPNDVILKGKESKLEGWDNPVFCSLRTHNNAKNNGSGDFPFSSPCGENLT